MINVEVKDKIGLEYDLYEVEDVSSVDDVLGYLYCARKIVKREGEYLDVQRQRNNIDKVATRILSPILRHYRYYPSYAFYVDDNRMLDLEKSLNTGYHNSLNRLIDIANDDNFMGIYKLASFTMQKYDQDTSKINEVRIRARGNGSYSDSTVNVDGRDFFRFFDKAIVIESLYASGIQFYK